MILFMHLITHMYKLFQKIFRYMILQYIEFTLYVEIEKLMKYASQSLIHIHDLVVYYTFSSMLLYLMKHTLDVENRCILKGIKTCVTHAFAVCALTYSFFFIFSCIIIII